MRPILCILPRRDHYIIFADLPILNVRYKDIMVENRKYRMQQYAARADVDAGALLKVRAVRRVEKEKYNEKVIYMTLGSDILI